MNNKLYIDEKQSLLIYETLEFCIRGAVHHVAVCSMTTNIGRTDTAEYWSRVLGVKAKMVERNTPILLIEKYRETVNQYELWHVIAGEKIGWILYGGLTKIKEMAQND
jgi:hypothetical protein